MLQNRLRPPQSTHSAASTSTGPNLRSLPSNRTAQTPTLAATMPSTRTSQPSCSKMTRFSHGIAKDTTSNSPSDSLRIRGDLQGGAVLVDDGVDGEGLPGVGGDGRPGFVEHRGDTARERGGVTDRHEASQSPVL